MIIALEEAKYRLENFRANIEELGSALRIDELREKLTALDATTQDPEFWNDQANSGKILKEVKRLKDKIAEYDDLYAKLEDTVTLAELAIEENDESMVEEVETAEKEILAEEEKIRIEILLSG
ncbi:MAG: PCRF domain-containing protein, partial [Clostridia bacterium]|nr:PCRF domain-containing protein [Clostridia bacterium]